MIEKRYICDKCSVIVKDGEKFWRMERQLVNTRETATLPMIWGDGITIFNAHEKAFHLCEDCMNRIFDWVKSEEQEIL